MGWNQKQSRGSLLLGCALVFMGLLAWLSFGWVGASSEAQRWIIEPFGLIPLGWSLVSLGGLLLLARALLAHEMP